MATKKHQWRGIEITFPSEARVERDADTVGAYASDEQKRDGLGFRVFNMDEAAKRVCLYVGLSEYDDPEDRRTIEHTLTLAPDTAYSFKVEFTEEEKGYDALYWVLHIEFK